MRFATATWKRGAIALLILFLAAVLSPAGGAPGGGGAAGDTKTDAPKKEEGKSEVPLLMSYADYYPIAVSDARFRIRHLNFDRRYAPTGLGEFLDVVFDVQNLTAQDLDLYIYVTAFSETDAVDNRYREVVPFPSWRKYDELRHEFLVRYARVTGQDGLKATAIASQIWDASDPDFKWARERIARMRDSAAVQKPIADVFPPIWKFVNYYFFNPTKGLKFKLYGNLGPEEADAIQTNFVRPSHKEQTSRVFESIDKHTYTLEHSRQRTVFRSHHYSEFRPNYRFFNKVAIVIFDAARADAFQKEIEPLLPRKKQLQLRRVEIRKQQVVADYNEDSDALTRLAGEEVALRRDEEQMSTEIRALMNKHKHLGYKKVFHIGQLKVY